jgi:putative tricarboxylic transport membrane protein
MLLGLCLVSAFSNQGEYLKTLMMTCFSLMLSTVGTDLSDGVQRFTFGRMDLIDGISFLMRAMATFALSEALMMVLRRGQSDDVQPSIDSRHLHLRVADSKFIAPTITRSSILGFFVGVLPGAGATIASLLAYGVERNLASKQMRRHSAKAQAPPLSY